MISILLTVTSEDYNDAIIRTKGFLETLGFGGQMLLLGMGTVFSVLLILWGCLSVFALVSKMRARAKAATPIAPQPEEAVQQPVTATTDDEEIIAVIAAAIATAENESNGAKFRVVSFRKI